MGNELIISTATVKFTNKLATLNLRQQSPVSDTGSLDRIRQRLVKEGGVRVRRE